MLDSFAPFARLASALTASVCLCACGSDEAVSTGADAGAPETDASSAACPLPSNPRLTSLCVELEPEAMDFESDARRDGRGVLLVQIFDTPLPDSDGHADQHLLAQQNYPEQPDGGLPIVETSVATLGSQRFVFRDIPQTVYVRAVFWDNFTALSQNYLGPGLWLGGFDLERGLAGVLSLQAVKLRPGEGHVLRTPLKALRRLLVRLELDAGVTPLDDGTGPGVALAFRDPQLRLDNPFFGVAPSKCIALSRSPTELEGVVLGWGDFYVFALLNDFNVPSNADGTISGSLLSIAASDAGTPNLVDKVSILPRQYTASVDIPFRQVLPIGLSGTLQAEPPGYTCVATSGGAPENQ